MRRLFVISALALASHSFGLTIGDPAPALKVAAVVKGTAVNLSKGLHVVEFWATWCGPCKQSIPHLTELAEKYKGKADFTGVSVWENGDNQLDQVKKFVATMGPQMSYNVDFDGDAKVMATTWMQAAKQNGIPAAFLIKDGKVLWIGHPMDGLDEAIGQVISGKFDLAASKAKFDQKMADAEKEEEQQKAMQTLLKPYVTAMKAKDYPAALKALDEVGAKKPEMKKQLGMARFNILVLEKSDDLLDYSKRLASEDYKDQPEVLNALAWSLVDPTKKIENPHYDAAIVLAKRAAEASDMKNPEILDTYALVLYKSGDKKQALEIQTKAVNLMKANPSANAAELKDLEDRLAQYQKESP